MLEYDVEPRGWCASRRGRQSKIERGSIFDVLDRETRARAIEPPAEPARGLIGGFVGYLGYECKADCGSPNVHRSDMPDAMLMLANRVIAVDHVAERTHLLALCRERRERRRGALAGRGRGGRARGRSPRLGHAHAERRIDAQRAGAPRREESPTRR